MTAKVGESTMPRAIADPIIEPRSIKLLRFDAVLRSVLAGPGLRPVDFEMRVRADVPVAPLKGEVGFTRSGTGIASGAEDASSVSIDPLEVSLSQPASSRIEAAPRLSPMDAAHVAVLERVVERLSFGGDRRTGIARFELGGPWAGAVLVVRVSGAQVELQLEGSGADAEARELGERVAARLRRRGFAAAVSVS